MASQKLQKTVIKINGNIESYCDRSNRQKTVLQLFEETVKLDNPEVLFDFAWGKEMKAEECISSSEILIKLNDIDIPVSIEYIERLKHILLKLPSYNEGYNLLFNPSLRKAWEISALEMYGSIQQTINLSSLVAYHLQLPTKLMDVQTQLQKVIMFEPGDQCFISNCSSCIANNKFGTVVLQLPVEGGHEGGNLNVECKRKKVVFENSVNSDKNFYLTAFYNCCDEFIEPITKGYKLILVFDLIWTNAKTEIPENFPDFLTALKAIKQVFKPWIRQNVVKSELGPRPSTRENQEYSSGVNGSDHLIPECTLKEKILFFILKEEYEEKFLAFELLRGQDRVLVELLLNCGFLDVHLAMATQSSNIRNEESLHMGCCESVSHDYIAEEQGSIKISTLIDSNDVTRNLSIQLDWNKHFVELIQSNQEKEVYYSENRKDKIELGKRNLHHGVLLIWPKHHSVPIYCRFGLHSLLIRISHKLNSLPKWKDEARQSVLSDLRQLVSFCCAEPQRAWTTSGLRKGELTVKLLRFCITLRAHEEGLDLLKLLGSNFHSENFEGIQNDLVAQAIADFVSQVTVWRDVAELIKSLLSYDRIAKQLLPIMKFAKFLLRTNCVQGAKLVGDSVSSFLAELDHTRVAKLKESDITAYMDMVVSLETNPDTCCGLRVASFILFFYKLPPSKQQCQLVRDLKTQYNWCLKSMQSFRFLLRELFESLIHLSEVSSAGSTTNFLTPAALIPLNEKENSEYHYTSSSCTPPETRSLLTPFTSTQQIQPIFFLNHNSQTITSPKFQCSIASPNAACDESINPPELVPYSPLRNTVTISNDPETTSCISGGGFLLERFREFFYSAAGREPSITGGSICSVSDYLFQLRDFELAFEELSRTSTSEVQADQLTGVTPEVFDTRLEGNYSVKSIQEENSKKNVDEVEKLQNSIRLDSLNAKASHSVIYKNENSEDNHTCSSCTLSRRNSSSTPFATTHEDPSFVFINNSYVSTSPKFQNSEASPKAVSGKSVSQQVIVPNHSPWNTASKLIHHRESSFISGKGFLLERFRELLDPSIEEKTSTTVGSIRSISDYLFQLRDFELVFEELCVSLVTADQPPGYGVTVPSLPIDWVRKLPVEDDHCQVASATSSMTAFDSALTTKCEHKEKYPKLALENASLDDVETSTTNCSAVPIIERKVKPNSNGTDANNLIGWLIPTSTYSSPGENIATSSIEKFPFHNSESSLSTIIRSDMAESSVLSRTFNDVSAVGMIETREKPISGTFFWKGVINSKEVGKINVKALELSASKLIPNLNMPSTLELIGRIKPEMIWDYINQTRRAGKREIVVISFIPASGSSQKMYSSFIRHMQHKERFAVVGPVSELIKDFYLVPLLKENPIPSALISFSQVFENRNSSMLLGIVIPSGKREAL